MMKKKQYLQIVKQLLSKSVFLDRYTVQEVMGSIDEYRKNDLSPGETANELIEIAETFKLIHKIVILEEAGRFWDPKPMQPKAPDHSHANTQDTER